MRITQKDIAKDLGISLITVSRALNNTGYVSKELKDRIEEYAREKNYVPHKASQALVRGTTRRIALFSSEQPSYFWDSLKEGSELAAEQIEGFNYQVLFHKIPANDSEYFSAKLRREIETGLDGIGLVNYRQYDMEKLIRIIEDAEIPYVTFNVDAPKSRRKCYIGPDYTAGGRLAAEFIGTTLKFKNKSKVLIININEEQRWSSENPNLNSERLRGFLQVMGERFPSISCELNLITTHYESEAEDTQIADILKEKQGSVDAVYLIPAFNDVFLKAIDTYDYSNAITLLHDLDQSAMHHLENHLLSAVIYQNPIMQGYYAVKTLERIIESPDEDFSDIEIIHNIILPENRSLIKNHIEYTKFSGF